MLFKNKVLDHYPSTANPTVHQLISQREGAKLVNLSAKVIQDRSQMTFSHQCLISCVLFREVVFHPIMSVLFSYCCSFQLHHWLSDWPALHPALWELLCDDVRWLLCHSAPHHCGGLWDLQCVLAIWSWQVRSFSRLCVTLEILNAMQMSTLLFCLQQNVMSESLPLCVSEDSLMILRQCWAGVPAWFTSTCGNTSAYWPCWGCWEPPSSVCSSNIPLTWHGTMRRYVELYERENIHI